MTTNLPGWLRLVLKELFKLAVYFGGIWFILEDRMPLDKILLTTFVSWGILLLDRLMRRTASRFGPAAKIWYYFTIILVVILLVNWISNGGF
jgi:hypothetical protein